MFPVSDDDDDVVVVVAAADDDDDNEDDGEVGKRVWNGTMASQHALCPICCES